MTRPSDSRWEHGSEFHFPVFEPREEEDDSPWRERSARFGSGRDALRAAIEHGARSRGWKRVLTPAYLCQEVTSAAGSAGLPLALYTDDPLSEPPDLSSARPGDVVLVVPYLGVRPPPDRRSLPAGVEVLEDHTHDPWSEWAVRSAADFCLVSLRKTLPVPDGAVLWSPRGHALPPEPAVTPERTLAALQKLAAMNLKALYLQGHGVEKAAFRALAVEGEAHIASGAVSGMSAFTQAFVGAFPTAAWRAARRRNWTRFVERLPSSERVRVLAALTEESCAFSALLVFGDPGDRERVRAALVERSIYPAILWPLEETVLPVPVAMRDLSRRILSVHCDGRYSAEDMDRVAAEVARALGASA